HARLLGHEIRAAPAIVEIEDLRSNGVLVDLSRRRRELPRGARDRPLGGRDDRSVLRPCLSNRRCVPAHGRLLPLRPAQRARPRATSGVSMPVLPPMAGSDSTFVLPPRTTSRP